MEMDRDTADAQSDHHWQTQSKAVKRLVKFAVALLMCSCGGSFSQSSGRFSAHQLASTAWSSWYFGASDMVVQRLNSWRVSCQLFFSFAASSAWRSERWKNTLRPQKTSTFLFFNNCQKLTDFDDFWCVKSWENLTSIACTFVHLTCIL